MEEQSDTPRTEMAEGQRLNPYFEGQFDGESNELRALRLTLVRERDEAIAAWWALVMGAAAALEDAANCLTDPDAKRAAEGAAKHYRTEANTLWPNA